MMRDGRGRTKALSARTSGPRRTAPHCPIVSSMSRDFARNGRALAAIALLAVVSITIAGAVFALTETQQNEVDTASARLDRMHDIALDVTGPIRSQEAALDDYVISGDAAALARYRDNTTAHYSNVALVAGGDFQLPDIESAHMMLDAIDREWRMTV